MSGPIKPEDVQDIHDNAIPEEVFTVFNSLIQRDWDGGSATVKQSEAVDEIAKVLGISRKSVFDQHLLDVDSAYRKAGWQVDYDKPAYCETYEAHWTFQKT